VEFAKLVRDQLGWKFGGCDAEENDFREALYQAHHDGKVRLEGVQGHVTVLKELPPSFFDDGGKITWGAGFPNDYNNEYVPAWPASTAEVPAPPPWRNLHVSDRDMALEWFSCSQAKNYRGRAREEFLKDRRKKLEFLIASGTGLEHACRSGNMAGWPVDDVVGWEDDDVRGFLRRLWPRHINRFDAAGRSLTSADASGGDAVADLVHAKVDALKEFLVEYS
jgi:hypothetical protein